MSGRCRARRACGRSGHLTTKQPTGRIWPPTSWAVDGTTAMCLHGLHLAHDCLEIAVLDDEGGRGFLRRVQARGVDAAGFSLMPHWEESAELARTYLRYPVLSSLVIGFAASVRVHAAAQ